MLIKSFLNVPGDYEKTLKARQRFALAIIALGLAGLVTFYGSAAALLIVLPLDRGAFFALLAAMAVYALAFLAGNSYYSKKL